MDPVGIALAEEPLPVLALVVDTAQMQPRGQSRGNQNIGACRVSTAHTSGLPSGSASGRAMTRLCTRSTFDS